MRALLTFLRTHKLAWILPIVAAALVAGLVAWRIASTPDNPFDYTLR